MLVISKVDVDSYISSIIGLVATKLNAEPNIESIKQKNPSIGGWLEAFVMAYRAWHQFHINLDLSEKNDLSSDEYLLLQYLINVRDTIRENLRSSVSEIEKSEKLFCPPYEEAKLEERLETYHLAMSL